MADDDESDEPFENLPTLRSQRRFLEVMSLVSAIYYWFDIRINTESSLLGQSVHVGSTRHVLTALWIGLIWAAWRYAQHLYQLWPDMANKIREDFSLEGSRLAIKIVRRYVSQMQPEEYNTTFKNVQGKLDELDFRGTAAVHRFDLRRANRPNAHGQAELKLPRGPLGEKSYSVIEATFFRIIGKGGQVFTFELGIARHLAFWLWIRAAIAAGFRRSAVFDFATPFIMLLFAVLSLVLAMTHPATSLPARY